MSEDCLLYFGISHPKFCVTKNSLAKLASKSTDYEKLNEFLTGPTALIFSEDPIAGIKVIKRYSDDNEKLKFVSARLDKKNIEIKEFETLAKLPSLDELRAKILGLINTPAGNIASLVNTPGTNLAKVVKAYSEKSEAA